VIDKSKAEVAAILLKSIWTNSRKTEEDRGRCFPNRERIPEKFQHLTPERRAEKKPLPFGSLSAEETSEERVVGTINSRSGDGVRAALP
jgi:hypothetical protein